MNEKLASKDLILENLPKHWEPMLCVSVDALIPRLEWDFCGFLPPLSEEEYGLLKEDIRARGVMVPIELNWNGEILDGKYRTRACKQLGINKVPVVTRRLLTEEEKLEHIVRLHVGRRQLSKKEKKKLAIKLRERGSTQERIANNLGVSQETISNWLKFTNIGEPTVVNGKDG